MEIEVLNLKGIQKKKQTNSLYSNLYADPFLGFREILQLAINK